MKDISEKLNNFIESAMQQAYEERLEGQEPDDLISMLKAELRRNIPTAKLQRKFDKLTQDITNPNKIQNIAQRLLSQHTEHLDVLFLALQENGLTKNIFQVDEHYTKDIQLGIQFCEDHRLRFDSFLACIMRHLPFGPFVEKYGSEIEYAEK